MPKADDKKARDVCQKALTEWEHALLQAKSQTHSNRLLIRHSAKALDAAKAAFEQLSERYQQTTQVKKREDITFAINDLARDCTIGKNLLNFKEHSKTITQAWSPEAFERARENSRKHNKKHEFYTSLLPCFIVLGIATGGLGLLIGSVVFGLSAAGTCAAAASAAQAAPSTAMHLAPQVGQKLMHATAPAWQPALAYSKVGMEAGAAYGKVGKAFGTIGYQAATPYIAPIANQSTTALAAEGGSAGLSLVGAGLWKKCKQPKKISKAEVETAVESENYSKPNLLA